jgi:uncharacterized protein (DUF4415 family)
MGKRKIDGFRFTVVEEKGKDVVIEVSEEDYEREKATGVEEAELLKPGRYKFRRGGFLERHPDFDPQKVKIKVHVKIPLDLDVLNFFKERASEPDAEPYQVQINNALREYTERAKNKRGSSSPATAESYSRLLDDEEFIEAVAERVRQKSVPQKISS